MLLTRSLSPLAFAVANRHPKGRNLPFSKMADQKGNGFSRQMLGGIAPSRLTLNVWRLLRIPMVAHPRRSRSLLHTLIYTPKAEPRHSAGFRAIWGGL